MFMFEETFTITHADAKLIYKLVIGRIKSQKSCDELLRNH